MRKVLISRYGAYGDIIHMSHLPRLLKEQGFNVVDVETNYKGYQLLGYNPFIDNLIFFEPTNRINVYSNPFVIQKHWEIISEGYDKFVNLFNSIEVSLIAPESSNLYFMHQKNRDALANINYYDQSAIAAGYPELVGRYRGEIFYPLEEHVIAQEYMAKLHDPIMINLNGTTLNKRMVIAPELIKRILKKYPEADIILTGDKNSDGLDIPSSPRIKSIIGVMPFRQALLMAKYSKLVITMESGFGVGANMWGVPTIQMMTCASLVNHPDDCPNDYSLQSPAPCSPCCKAQYKFIGCPVKDGYPLCVFFDVDLVMKQVEKAYDYSVRKEPAQIS